MMHYQIANWLCMRLTAIHITTTYIQIISIAYLNRNCIDSAHRLLQLNMNSQTCLPKPHIYKYTYTQNPDAKRNVQWPLLVSKAKWDRNIRSQNQGGRSKYHAYSQYREVHSQKVFLQCKGEGENKGGEKKEKQIVTNSLLLFLF